MTTASNTRVPNPPVSRRACAALLVAGAVLAAAPAAHSAGISRYRDRPDDWFKTDEGREVVRNILSWQQPLGGWWKNYDAATTRPANPPEHDAPLAPKDD